MTAQEARQITTSTKKDINHVLKSVETMAKSGHDGATFETKIFLNPEDVKSKLTDLGYTVEEISGFLTVKW